MTRPTLPPRLRRPLATLFAAAAAWLALLTLRPGPPPTVQVLAAARDLPAGATLAPSDVRPVPFPAGAAPSGALRSGAAGRVLAGPMRRGEPLTDVRVIGDRLLRGHGPGKVAAPVRIADADTVRLVRPGDRIDVLAAPPEGLAVPEPPGETPPDLPHHTPAAAPSARPAGDASPWGGARVVVSSVPVIAVPAADEKATRDGALLVLATTRSQASALAGARTDLSVTIAPT
ncbi:SAF domain-containing protein [Actinomadura rifamycini]|uniref:SAF domain-containing protein n=1 Tax=Actinomadura rifamycini TaxID=31962 RepID=UPI0003F81F8F|nr:SAF domain-containing protein [Actinomadura rifamycini]